LQREKNKNKRAVMWRDFLRWLCEGKKCRRERFETESNFPWNHSHHKITAKSIHLLLSLHERVKNCLFLVDPFSRRVWEYVFCI
jgi:hypothetical protein